MNYLNFTDGLGMIGITLEREHSFIFLFSFSTRNIGMFPVSITCLGKMRDLARMAEEGSIELEHEVEVGQEIRRKLD